MNNEIVLLLEALLSLGIAIFFVYLSHILFLILSLTLYSV